MGLLPGSSLGNTEKAAPGDKGGVENGAGRAMVVAMPRDGATIFSDLIGKLDVLRRCEVSAIAEGVVEQNAASHFLELYQAGMEQASSATRLS
jgi:hypothetical protein